MLADPPRNGEYLIAAYTVTSVILLGYWTRLWRRAKGISKQPPR
jgi:CcmD family protein